MRLQRWVWQAHVSKLSKERSRKTHPGLAVAKGRTLIHDGVIVKFPIACSKTSVGEVPKARFNRGSIEHVLQIDVVKYTYKG